MMRVTCDEYHSCINSKVSHKNPPCLCCSEANAASQSGRGGERDRADSRTCGEGLDTEQLRVPACRCCRCRRCDNLFPLLPAAHVSVSIFLSFLPPQNPCLFLLLLLRQSLPSHYCFLLNLSLFLAPKPPVPVSLLRSPLPTTTAVKHKTRTTTATPRRSAALARPWS